MTINKSIARGPTFGVILSLAAITACKPSVVVDGDDDTASVHIYTEDASGIEMLTQTVVSVVQTATGCEYRLEYVTPDDPDGAIGEVSGNQGPPQRHTNTACNPAFFNVREDGDFAKFEEQTIYYWSKRARDYAVTNLWITPPGWNAGPIKRTPGMVQPNLLTDGNFNLACTPNAGARSGCMRNWQHEGPKMHFRAGRASARLVAHEFGHYAAGYVYGHMDVLGLNGFDITQCAKRSFQETIASIFENLVIHNVVDAGNAGGAAPTLDILTVWDGQCGSNDYRMGAPLLQAFYRSLWGNWPEQSVNWSSAAESNTGMANAFSYALALNRGHRIDTLAGHILEHIRNNQNNDIHGAVAEIFRRHGLRSIGDACSENIQCSGERTSRCDNTVAPNQCIPDNGHGRSGDYCTNNNHCNANQNLLCEVSVPGGAGFCQAQ